jgi:hypothetical protein
MAGKSIKITDQMMAEAKRKLIRMEPTKEKEEQPKPAGEHVLCKERLTHGI